MSPNGGNSAKAAAEGGSARGQNLPRLTPISFRPVDSGRLPGSSTTVFFRRRGLDFAFDGAGAWILYRAPTPLLTPRLDRCCFPFSSQVASANSRAGPEAAVIPLRANQT